jgi:hypothetical protein
LRDDGDNGVVAQESGIGAFLDEHLQPVKTLQSYLVVLRPGTNVGSDSLEGKAEKVSRSWTFSITHSRHS